MVEENLNRILAVPQDLPDDDPAALTMLFEACMQMHRENQGQSIRRGWCRIGTREMSRSDLNLHRLYEEAIAKGREMEHEILSAAARRELLLIFPVGSSLTEAVSHLTSLGFECTEDVNANQISCTYNQAYLGIYDSKPETLCGQEWYFHLKSDGSDTLQALEVEQALGCL
jgi:hypothetical protein